jgi:hypothetical protein
MYYYENVSFGVRSSEWHPQRQERQTEKMDFMSVVKQRLVNCVSG